MYTRMAGLREPAPFLAPIVVSGDDARDVRAGMRACARARASAPD